MTGGMAEQEQGARVEREMRVFISSTFRDMLEEREELVKRVFPRLRGLSERRGVVWGDVDLRWGVTDEQKAEGGVLPVCLKEIESCRPYFIGLLGDRYGWVPQELPQQVAERYPWLEEQRGHSVMELEILHGVLRDPAMARYAFFYFRDPAYEPMLSAETFSEYVSEDPEAAGKLARLKERIRASGSKVRENYANAKMLGELVFADFKAVLDERFPEGSEPDPLAREAAEHASFARSRSRVYVGMEECLDRLDAHAETTGPPLVVVGEVGSGKSALLARWGLRYRESHPGDTVLMHFAGSSPSSADWTGIARRILGEFQSAFKLKASTPDQPDGLRAALASLIEAVGRQLEGAPQTTGWLARWFGRRRTDPALPRRVVLILDGLDQLEDKDGGPDLSWLPTSISPAIRVVVSAGPGATRDDLLQRGWLSMDMKALSSPQRARFVKEYLEYYGKRLDPQRLDRISSADQTSNPLYLRALLEELRLFGKHEDLDMCLDRYLSAAGLAELFGRILERWEQDYGGVLVRDSMTFLWAARRGLSEAELLDLLGQPAEPLPQAAWAPLFVAAGDSIVSLAGVLGFSHHHLRQAVQARYIAGHEDQRAAHLRIARYFESRLQLHAETGAALGERATIVQDVAKATAAAKAAGALDQWQQEMADELMASYTLGARELDELPWQLSQAGDWERLYDLLARPEVAANCWIFDKYAVRRYWKQLEAQTGRTAAQAYQPALAEPERPASLTEIANLLSALGNTDQAAAAEEALANQYRRTGNFARLALALGNLLADAVKRGHIDRATALANELEAVQSRLGVPAASDTLELSRGDLCRIKGEPKEALAHYQEAERWAKRGQDRASLARALGNQALVHESGGQLGVALKLRQEEETICRELHNLDGLAISLVNQAGMLRKLGETEKAWEVLQEHEQLCRTLGNKRGLAGSWDEQALILSHRDRARALALLNQVEEASRELGDQSLLAACLGNQVGLLVEQGKYAEALPVLERQEAVAQQMGDRRELARCRSNRGLVLLGAGDPRRALGLFQEQEQICRQIVNTLGLSLALFHQGQALFMLGRIEECRRKTLEGYELARRHGFQFEAAQMEPVVRSLR